MCFGPHVTTDRRPFAAVLWALLMSVSLLATPLLLPVLLFGWSLRNLVRAAAPGSEAPTWGRCVATAALLWLAPMLCFSGAVLMSASPVSLSLAGAATAALWVTSIPRVFHREALPASRRLGAVLLGAFLVHLPMPALVAAVLAPVLIVAASHVAPREEQTPSALHIVPGLAALSIIAVVTLQPLGLIPGEPENARLFPLGAAPTSPLVIVRDKGTLLVSLADGGGFGHLEIPEHAEVLYGRNATGLHVLHIPGVGHLQLTDEGVRVDDGLSDRIVQRVRGLPLALVGLLFVLVAIAAGRERAILLYGAIMLTTTVLHVILG